MPSNLDIVDGNAQATKVKTTEAGGVHTPHNNAALLRHDGATLVSEDTDGNLPIISHRHLKVHLGELFTLQHYIATLANGSSYDVLIRVPAGLLAHINTEKVRATNAPCDVFLYSAPVTTADGTAVDIVNSNFSSANTPLTLAFSSPTVTSPGTIKHRDLLVGAITGGSVNTSADEFELAPGTDYLLRVANNSGGNVAALIKLSWYEKAVI